MNQTLYWLPRVFGIMFIVVATLFVFDIERFSWGALFMHLLPALVVLVALLIAWKQEMIGGILFIILGIAYIILAWGKTPWMSFLVMSGPAFVIGVLFLLPKNQLMAAPAADVQADSSVMTDNQFTAPPEPENTDSQETN
jgi:hypothetical protein